LIWRYLAKRWKQNVNFITTVQINESARMRTEYRYFEYEINAKFWCKILTTIRCIFEFNTVTEMKKPVLRMKPRILNHRVSRLFSYSSLSQDLRGSEYSYYKRIESGKWEIGMRMLSWQNENILLLGSLSLL